RKHPDGRSLIPHKTTGQGHERGLLVGDGFNCQCAQLWRTGGHDHGVAGDLRLGNWLGHRVRVAAEENEEGRMTNDEDQITKEVRNPKAEARKKPEGRMPGRAPVRRGICLKFWLWTSGP